MSQFPNDINALYTAKLRLERIAISANNSNENIKEELKKLSEIENPDEGVVEYIHSLNAINKKNTEFTNIYNAITKYLDEHCCHEFTDDYIDTSPEAGMNIRYCIHCYKT